MKRFDKIKNFLLLCLLFVSFLPAPSFGLPTATGPCDTCTTPWGPVIQKIYYNQTVPFMTPSCLYDVRLSIQTRLCGGKLQVRTLDQYIAPKSTSSACDLYCINVGYLMQKITKLLLADLGGNIVFNKPSSCYYLLEFSLSPALEACMGMEAGLHDNWYSALPCETNGCCITEYVLQADGSVRANSTASSPCGGTPPSPIPTTITVYCWSMGVRTPYTVNVVPPPTPLTCEPACTATASIFTAKTTGKAEQTTVEHTSIIYPNPTDEELHIAGDWEQLFITDMQGKTIQAHHNTGKAINVHGLAAGTYMILLETATGHQQKHLMIKK
ncbi:MAG TPA: T9SS type A sorting domain-containing protein [Chitinophagaceae bacterium]|nr:T9SS type A sorting domain-containing protein [Chitinophagaceae bacterium]